MAKRSPTKTAIHFSKSFTLDEAFEAARGKFTDLDGALKWMGGHKPVYETGAIELVGGGRVVGDPEETVPAGVGKVGLQDAPRDEVGGELNGVPDPVGSIAVTSMNCEGNVIPNQTGTQTIKTDKTPVNIG